MMMVSSLCDYRHQDYITVYEILR